MKKDITKLKIHVTAIPKGKRKPKFDSIEVLQFDGHLTLDPDQLNYYEREAWNEVDDQFYKCRVTTGKLVVYHGFEDNDMVTVKILPHQTQLIMRT